MGINTSPILQLHDLPNKVDSLIKYMFPEQQRGGVSSFHVNTYHVGAMRCDIKLPHRTNGWYKLHIYDMYSQPKYDLFTKWSD